MRVNTDGCKSLSTPATTTPPHTSSSTKGNPPQSLSQQLPPSPPPPPTYRAVPFSRLYLLATGFFGISFLWALQFALVTPFLTETLRTSITTSHLIWLLGPISGLITAPIVGYLSDQPTRHDHSKRSPFIAGGAVGAVLGSLLFAHAQSIAKAIPGTSALLWAALGFGIQDCSLNAAMFPLRALVGDVAGPSQQQDAQAVVMVMATAGEVAASATVAFCDKPLERLRLLFGIAAGFAVGTVGITVAFGNASTESGRYMDLSGTQEFEDVTENVMEDDVRKHFVIDENREEDLVEQNGHQGESLLELFWPPRREVLCITAVNALGWLSLFCCMPYLSSWLGQSVLHGDPTAPLHTAPYNLYQHGITLYGRANTIKALLSLLLSINYPFILRSITPQRLLALSFIPMLITLLLDAFFPNKPFALTSIALLAIPYIALHTTPYGLVSRAFPGAKGTLFAVLNTSGVIAQLADTLYTGTLAKIAGERAVLALGAVWAGLTALAAAMLL